MRSKEDYLCHSAWWAIIKALKSDKTYKTLFVTPKESIAKKYLKIIKCLLDWGYVHGLFYGAVRMKKVKEWEYCYRIRVREYES